MLDAKAKILEHIMDMCDGAMVKKAQSKKAPAIAAISIEAEKPEQLDEEERKEEPEISEDDLKALLSQLGS